MPHLYYIFTVCVYPPLYLNIFITFRVFPVCAQNQVVLGTFGEEQRKYEWKVQLDPALRNHSLEMNLNQFLIQ